MFACMTPSDWILLGTGLVVLWYTWETHQLRKLSNKQTQAVEGQLKAMQQQMSVKEQDREETGKLLRQTVSQCLSYFLRDLERIASKERNPSAGPEDDALIRFSLTSVSEIGHYYRLFTDAVVPNLLVLSLPSPSKTIEFFDHYAKNLEKVRTENHLMRSTVNNLIERAKAAIAELSQT